MLIEIKERYIKSSLHIHDDLPEVIDINVNFNPTVYTHTNIDIEMKYLSAENIKDLMHTLTIALGVLKDNQPKK